MDYRNLRSTVRHDPVHEFLIALDPVYKEYEQNDSGINSFPFMNSPRPLLVVLSMYLNFVLWVGQKYMKSRQPLDIRRYLIYYNAIQIILNAGGVLILLSFDETRSILYRAIIFWRTEEEVMITSKQVKCMVWWYLMLKILDLFDTVHIILKKKYNQVSFLHVYHHTSICVMGWFMTRYIIAELFIVVGFLNVFVHAVIYTYYLLAAMGEKYKKYLWFKKYVTIIQMTQFVLVILYILTSIMFRRKIFLLPLYIGTVYALSFLILFSNFFIKAYLKKGKSK